MPTEVPAQLSHHRTTGSNATAQEPLPPFDIGLPARMRILPWNDPSLAERGVDPRGEYTERFWLGVVGPSV